MFQAYVKLIRKKDDEIREKINVDSQKVLRLDFYMWIIFNYIYG